MSRLWERLIESEARAAFLPSLGSIVSGPVWHPVPRWMQR